MRDVIDNIDRASYHIREGKKESADRLLTVQDICELLKVPRTYVYWLTHQKKIPYIKMQGHLRFRRSHIDQWLNSQEVRDAGLQKDI